jgi:integrase
VSTITRRDVRELAEEIVERRGPVAGNRAFGHLHRFFEVLVQRDVIAASPCHGLKPPGGRETARERVLSDDEIGRLWLAPDTLAGPAAAAIKLMLFSGQRRGEVAGMTFSEIDGDTWLLSRERSKNRKAHAVPLSRQARDLIERQPKIDGCEFVFTTGRRPIADWPRVKKVIDAIMKPDARWTLHDLRRTVASGLAKLGVALPTIEKVLNHSSGSFRGIVSVYQRHDFALEKAAALQVWADHVERIVKGEERGKIIRLR